VFANEEEASYATIADGSYTCLYLKYNHSIETIRIMGTNAIPEFRLTAVTVLSVAVALLLVVAYKRRHLKQLRPISTSAF
jgi:hypothetical protein